MDRNEALRQQAEFYADASDQWVRGDTDKAERFEKAAEIADQLAALLEGVERVRTAIEQAYSSCGITGASYFEGKKAGLEKALSLFDAAQGAAPVASHETADNGRFLPPQPPVYGPGNDFYGLKPVPRPLSDEDAKAIAEGLSQPRCGGTGYIHKSSPMPGLLDGTTEDCRGCEDCQPDPVTAKCRTCGVPIKPDADNQIHCARCAPFHTPPPDGVTLMQSTGSPKRTSPVTVTTDPPDTHGQWIGSNDGGGR